MRTLAALALFAFAAPNVASAQLMEAVLLGNAGGRPTGILAAPGVPDQMYVAEKTGRVFVFRNGSIVSTPCLDIRGLVDGEGENGLLGMAFDPDFETNRTFYLSYTLEGTAFGDSVVSRWQMLPGTDDFADPNSEEILFGPYPQTSFGHKAGDLAIGLDGMLYVGLGDGDAGSSTMSGAAQDLSDPRGSVLRIDPSIPAPYVPADNPYVGTPGADPYIWAPGFRNPYRIDVDPLTGDLYVGDVGGGRWEEVTRLPAGQGAINAGWPCTEGPQCVTHPSCSCASPTLTGPLVAKSHNAPDQFCAMIGGVVYRGDDIPGLYGQYIYSDFCSAGVHGIIDPAGAAIPVDYSDVIVNPGTGFQISTPGDIGRGPDGEIYIAEHYSARIWKIVPKAGAEAYCDSLPNSSGAVATLAVTGSTSLADANMSLEVTDLPPSSFGFFIVSPERGLDPNFSGSDGVLCVGAPIFRWNDVVSDSGAAGTVTRTTDFTDLPFGVSIAAGETWNFQYWTRDLNPIPTSNTSSAVAVTFAP
ncbi:MAG: PQQ-dependent sugar dehydrogenase [Planctomycetota bacterium]